MERKSSDLRVWIRWRKVIWECGLGEEDPSVYVGLMPVYSGTFCLFIQAAGELKHQTFTCLPGERGEKRSVG